MKLTIERHPCYPMEHQISELRNRDGKRSESEVHSDRKRTYCKVAEVNHRPTYLLCHSRNNIHNNFAQQDEDNVYEPSTLKNQFVSTRQRHSRRTELTFGVDPVSIDIHVCTAVQRLFCVLVSYFFHFDDTSTTTSRLHIGVSRRYGCCERG